VGAIAALFVPRRTRAGETVEAEPGLAFEQAA
jgi:hypothetical protein